ncbi:hypothetical protein P7C70_g3086, partial [Phenoliferia sp. Uapishka_3]
MHLYSIVYATVALAASVTASLEVRGLESRSSLATVHTTCTEPGKPTLYNISSTFRATADSMLRKLGTFALSFDDGPYKYGAALAKYFERHNSLASFFVNGQNYDCIYDYADDLIARYQAGHLIGSHTWGHDDIATLTGPEFEEQLTLVETALKKILGIKPRFFRPVSYMFVRQCWAVPIIDVALKNQKPYGSYNKANLAILKKRGYTGEPFALFKILSQILTRRGGHFGSRNCAYRIRVLPEDIVKSHSNFFFIQWDFDSGDSKGFSTSQSIAAYNTLLKGKKTKFPAPHMALNHETYKGTAQKVVENVVPKLLAAKYKLVTIAQCLGTSPYQSVGPAQKRDSTWTCAGTPGPGQAQ